MTGGLRSVRREITVTIDDEVNAAAVDFSSFPAPGEIIDCPIMIDGSMVAIASFSRGGRLVQLQLLDASRQLAGWDDQVSE